MADDDVWNIETFAKTEKPCCVFKEELTYEREQAINTFYKIPTRAFIGRQVCTRQRSFPVFTPPHINTCWVERIFESYANFRLHLGFDPLS